MILEQGERPVSVRSDSFSTDAQYHAYVTATTRAVRYQQWVTLPSPPPTGPVTGRAPPADIRDARPLLDNSDQWFVLPNGCPDSGDSFMMLLFVMTV